MTDFSAERREMIKRLGVAGAGTLAAGMLMGAAAKVSLRTDTPSQPEGPFYPVRDQIDKDADMTHVKGRSETAKGERIRLSGRLLDANTGAAISGALVEFWQACESGRYNHPKDPNTAPLDPNFQYWAQVRTDEQGRFGLLTIKPGAYPADESWTRPPHIHVKVHQAGYPSLTTQLYFAGEPLNDEDQILQKLPSNERRLVIVEFNGRGVNGEALGDWTIFIAPFAIVTDPRARGQIQLTPEIE